MRKCLRCDGTWDGETWQCPRCHYQPSLLEGFTAFAPQLAWGDDGYDAAFHQLLATLEENCFWFVARNQLLGMVFQRFFPGAKSFLEVGCGTGYVLSALQGQMPRLKVVAGELFLSGLRQSRARLPQAEVIQMDARHIPYRAEFDVIGSFDVLEHLDQDDAAVAQIHDALKPGGGCLITVPQHPWLWSCQDEAAHHKRRYSRGELRSKLETAGFRVLWMTSFVSLLLPVMAASRLVSVGGIKEEELALQLRRLPASLDIVFGWICDLERTLIAAGASLPVGGSLLAVGVKL
jgi:SAM-dependent methyltransferase